MIDPGSHGVLELPEGSAQRRVGDGLIWEHEGEARTQQAVVGSSEEEGVSQTALRDLVPMTAWNASNHPVQAEASEIVGNAARREVVTTQGFQALSEIAVREAVG